MFTHSNNSQFQYLFFIVGKCHSADEAYRMLHNELEGREVAIKTYEASLLSIRAEKMRLDFVREHAKTEWERLAATADLAKIEANKPLGAVCYQEALRERAFIQKLIDFVQPHRQFAHLPDHEAMQACQFHEWQEEMKFRAENYVLAEGRIPADQLGAMRLHPAFDDEIMPHIEACIEMAKQGKRLSSPPFGQRLMTEVAPKLLPGYGENSTDPKLLKE